MTNNAHRDGRRNKLSYMAAGAGLVTGKVGYRGIIAALVTGIAGQGGVLLAVVLES